MPCFALNGSYIIEKSSKEDKIRPKGVVPVLGIPDIIIGFSKFFILLLIMESIKNKEKIYTKCIKSVKNASSKDKLKIISDSLFDSFKNWIFCGFYLKRNNQLIIIDYKSLKIPCSPISLSGVCGTAIEKNEVLNIPDVDKFPGHIVCDPNSRSEICIPFKINSINYVLDIDSKKVNDFDEIDCKYLTKITKNI